MHLQLYIAEISVQVPVHLSTSPNYLHGKEGRGTAALLELCSSTRRSQISLFSIAFGKQTRTNEGLEVKGSIERLSERQSISYRDVDRSIPFFVYEGNKAASRGRSEEISIVAKCSFRMQEK